MLQAFEHAERRILQAVAHTVEQALASAPNNASSTGPMSLSAMRRPNSSAVSTASREDRFQRRHRQAVSLITGHRGAHRRLQARSPQHLPVEHFPTLS